MFHQPGRCGCVTLLQFGPEDRRGFFSPSRPPVSTSARPPRASRLRGSVVAALLLNIPAHFHETVTLAGLASFPTHRLLGAQQAAL